MSIAKCVFKIIEPVLQDQHVYKMFLLNSVYFWMSKKAGVAFHIKNRVLLCSRLIIYQQISTDNCIYLYTWNN